MAMSDSPEDKVSPTSATDQGDSDTTCAVRRRVTAAVPNGAASTTTESETLEKDRNGIFLRGGDDVDVDRKNSADGGGGSDVSTTKLPGLPNATSISTDGGEIEASPVKFAYRPSAPAHMRVKESPLSSDAIFKQSHAGLFNLCIVVLVAVNSRLIIENLMKYGLLIRAGFWFSANSLRDWPLFMCCLSLPIFPLAAFLIEKSAQRNFVSDLVAVSLHVIISTTSIMYPVFVIIRCDSAVLSGVTLMLFACTVWLKLVSYAHTNYDIRVIARASCQEVDSSKTIKELAYKISFKQLVYFMVAPTLCYQTIYPRTDCIRKGWVTSQLIKLVIFMGVMGFIIEQYINPIVKNSQHPLKGNILYAIERVLKLSVPNLYVWLCMFYCFFHLWLNILAELLRFGDREFYRDWWNARTFEEYWRMWNVPVHKWMVRHVYFPCLRHGMPKGVSVVIAFFISAVFHELCITVPCHIFKLWAFIGIMFQVPLVMLTNFIQRKFNSSMVGNMIFWFIFSVFGQPMCVLLYYHDLMNQKGKSSMMVMNE